MPFSFSLAATRLTRMESDVVRVCCCRCRVQCAVQEKQTLENNGCVCEDETRELQYYSLLCLTSSCRFPRRACMHACMRAAAAAAPMTIMTDRTEKTNTTVDWSSGSGPPTPKSRICTRARRQHAMRCGLSCLVPVDITGDRRWASSLRPGSASH